MNTECYFFKSPLFFYFLLTISLSSCFDAPSGVDKTNEIKNTCRLISQGKKYKNIDICEEYCQKGDLQSCNRLAYYWNNEKPSKAAVYLRIACQSNKSDDYLGPVACRKLAEMYFEGKGVNKDNNKGESLLRKSCDRGHGYACHKLGLYLYSAKADLVAARKLFRQACKLKAPWSCPGAGEVKHSKSLDQWRVLQILQGTKEP